MMQVFVFYYAYVCAVTFEVTAHFGDAGACSIRVPSLKFVNLPISKIWLIFGHGFKRPGDLDL